MIIICVTISIPSPPTTTYQISDICNNLEGFFPDIRRHRNSPLVSRTLADRKRLYGRSTRRKRALTREDLLLVYKDLVTSSHDDCLFLTQLLTGFGGLLRLGELVWSDSTANRSAPL